MRGPETEKSHDARERAPCPEDGSFYNRFMKGPGLAVGKGLDIGYKGDPRKKYEPVLQSATGVDLGYPGYDGHKLPFPELSQDYVFSSHCLEHVTNSVLAIREWFRVVKMRGHLVIIVPHKYLYERKHHLPSRWNGDHKRFYTPDQLLKEIDAALKPNEWRLRWCRDNDDDYDYSIAPPAHPGGCYEIECVIQKIQPPAWGLE